VWHFGWNTPDSRKYNEMFRAMGLEIAQMWDAADGKLVDMSSDTLPGCRHRNRSWRLRAKGVQPTRQGGFGYLRGPDGAMIENAQAGDSERFNHVHMYHEHPRCAMDWYVTHLGARMPQGRGGRGGRARATGRRRDSVDQRRLQDDRVRAADLAVVRQNRVRARSRGRREHRRHLDLDSPVARRRPGQHARQAGRPLGGEHRRTSTPPSRA
jgi:hypothetical protein